MISRSLPRPKSPMAPTDEQPPQSTPDPDQETTARPRRSRPRHDFPETQAGKLWKALENPSGGPVNEMPGGTYNTAGGKPRETTWRDAFNAFSFENNKDKPFLRFFKTSCARDALLIGICFGGGVGGLRFILRGLTNMWATSNYAVGGFALSSCGMYTWCEHRRKVEAQGMAQAVAGMKMLHEKKAREEAEQKKLLQEQKRRHEEEQLKNKRWWKPWS